MPTVFLHIGAPKTATSTLQRALSNNYQQLREIGVLYPRACRSGNAHHTLACDLIETHQGFTMPDFWYDDIPRRASWQLLQEEIVANRAGLKKVILSTELLSGQDHRLPDMLEDIQAHLQDFDIKIIAYLRRQDQLYSSLYNQDVKGARQWTGSAYEFYETHQLLRNDYDTVLQSWANTFGGDNILLRPFEQQQWVDGSVFADFCAATGIPPIEGYFRDQNEGIGATQLYMKRCLNSAGFPKEQNDKVLALVKEIFPEIPAKGLLYVNRSLYRKYRAHWMQVNDTLSKRYLDSRPLFAQPIPEAEQVEIHSVATEDTAKFADNCLQLLSLEGNAEYRPLFARAILFSAIDLQYWESLPVSTQQTLQNWMTQV